jgi:hypothetical protein
MGTKTELKNQGCRRYREQIEQLADSPTLQIRASLARHVETCPDCRELLNELTAVRYTLDQVKWQSMPAGTLALCNRKALKKLQQQVRESEKGQELSIAKPDLPYWQQATIRIGRGGIGVAAGLAVVMFNWAVSGGLNVTHDELQRLGQIHQKHHIGNWNDLNSDVS